MLGDNVLSMLSLNMFRECYPTF